jgi:hypothetical protein
MKQQPHNLVVVDFLEQIPPLHTELCAGTGEDILIEIITYLDGQRVRCFALTRTQSLFNQILSSNQTTT